MSSPDLENPDSGSNDSKAPVRQPWWIPRALGRVPAEIREPQLKLLGAIALALVFEHYDLSMISAAAKHIRESFDIPQSDLGEMMAWVRLGSLPAVILVPFADRIGRRRLFIACIIGTSVATFATAFTQNVTQFIVAQMFVRTCLLAGSAVAFVIVAEEFPAKHRGWAIGVLGALGAAGHGLGALVFSQVDRLPYGWRALYAFGALPILLLPMFRRRVTETRRFEEQAAANEDDAVYQTSGWWRPFGTLARQYPLRTLAIAAIGLLSAAGYATAFTLLGDYVQTDHGWTPGDYSTMILLGGAFGILGNTLVGRMADRGGRRLVGFATLAAFPFLAAGFYLSDGIWIPIFWIPMVFVATGGGTIVRALSTELFPTAARGTASGSLTFFETLGGAGGLALVTYLTVDGASNAPVTSVLVFTALLAGIAILFLPETARRELEDIS